MSARHGLLLPVAAILFGLTACGSTPAPAPIPAAAPSAAPTSAAPAPTAEATSTAAATPTSTRPATKQPVTTAAAGKCPSAKALEKLTDLPKDWHFVPSSVECWKGWATASPEGPATGDGVYLFRNQAGSGWRYHSQGSGYHCKELGINEAAPFCQYP
ncbi:hypothetical protein AB0M54_43925 [Actinoplanes sp. NPDC051470]|uniref:hypothetical protein n=1 Tax=Actinoplanes sp. NPDC051470 TaxID=3157224 RepID=UPI003416749E